MASVAHRVTSFPASLAAVADRVEARILGVVDAEVRRWVAVDPVLADPLLELRAFIEAGGKRLRPAFCHCAFVGAGGDPQETAVVDAGAALELIHTFALVHDDVMDGSDTRRSRPAVHRRFADEHAAAGWRSEPRRFGDGMAILVGDFAFVYADILMRNAPPAALDVFDTLRIELCVGQSLDLVSTAHSTIDTETAQRIATYKSAKYTVEGPLHLGAALVGRLDDLAEPLSAIGLPLGAAFQLRDDILGAFGDSALTGKPVGDDLREGKTTPLIAIADERGTPADRAALERLGAPDFGATDVAALQAVFERTGARQEVEVEIERLVTIADDALAAAPIDAVARGWLAELANYVAWRDH